MKLWLAVDKEDNSLGVVEAETPDQAFYQFMPDGIYPDRVILLPDTLILKRQELERGDEYYRLG